MLLIHDVNGDFAAGRLLGGGGGVPPSQFSQATSIMRSGTWAHLRDSRSEEDPVSAFVRGVSPIPPKLGTYSAFLVTLWSIARCFWRFGSVQVPTKAEPRGDPIWKTPEKLEQQNTFRIPDCTIDDDYQPLADAFIVSGCCESYLVLLLPLLLIAFVHRWA